MKESDNMKLKDFLLLSSVSLRIVLNYNSNEAKIYRVDEVPWWLVDRDIQGISEIDIDDADVRIQL